MTEVETLLSSFSEHSRVPVHVLRAVWMREASSARAVGDVSLQCQRRVRDFLLEGPRSLDADLWPETTGPVLVARGRFEENLHPRDRKGRFIDKIGDEVKIFPSGASDVPNAVGTITKVDSADEVTVRIKTATGSGKGTYTPGGTYKVSTGFLESVNEKAHLGEPAPAPKTADRPSGELKPGDVLNYIGVTRVEEVYPGGMLRVRDNSGMEDFLGPDELAEAKVVARLDKLPDVNAPDARPEADFSNWGDRAQGILDAYYNRPSLLDMQQAGRDANTAVAQKAFGLESDKAIFNVDTVRRSGHGTVTFEGTVHDPRDPRKVIGTFERMIVPVGTDAQHNEDPYIFNSVLEIDPAYQGQGIAKDYYKHVEDWAIANGIHEIRLDANISIGGYAWARAGFDWDFGPGRRDAAEYVVGGMLNRVREWTQDQELRDKVEEMLRRIKQSQWLPTPFEVSTLGWHDGLDIWEGKEAMIGTSWAAKKYLRPSLQS